MEKRKIFTICFLALGMVLCLGGISKAAGWMDMSKLLAPVISDYAHFGSSVSISGDYAVVGAPNVGDDNGSAYLFKRNGFTWSFVTELHASDNGPSDNFGFSVFISGDLAIVGAPRHRVNGIWAGAAYIFRRSGTTWAQEAELAASEGVEGSRFGCSVSISGDYAVIGAEGFNDYSGTAYIFKRDGTTWSQQAQITGSDTDFSDAFGCSVSISGDSAIIGAYGNDCTRGAAYIFSRVGTAWNQEAKLIASDG